MRRRSIALGTLAAAALLAAGLFPLLLRTLDPVTAVTVATLQTRSTTTGIPDDLAHGEVRVVPEPDRLDPWGNAIRRKYESKPKDQLAKNVSRSASSSSYSIGPNGIDEGGLGDDVVPPFIFRKGLYLQCLIVTRRLLLLLAAALAWLAWGPGSRPDRGGWKVELLRGGLLGGPPAIALGAAAGWLIHASGSFSTGLPLPLWLSVGLTAAVPPLLAAITLRATAPRPAPVECE